MKFVQKILLVIMTLLAPFLGIVTRAYAEGQQVVISENGSGSTNEAHTSQSNAVDVSQNNTADVDNTVDVDANTGNNQASDNAGGNTGITTGDANVASSISNDLNTSIEAANTCCPTGGTEGTINGNGSNSTNSISFTSSFSANAQVNNTASVTNNINGSVNTGNNKANDNNGNVSISTGNISVVEKIFTKANVSYVSLGFGSGSSYILDVSKNGTGSSNAIDITERNNIVTTINNHANIFNNSFWDLVTGYNEANGNNGDVSIATGDIEFDSTIINKANISIALITCCKKEEPKPENIVPPEKPVAPKGPSENNNSAQGASGSSSESPGSAIQNVLPVTGNMWFFLALVGNIAALIFGTYLRLRSGRSPALAFS